MIKRLLISILLGLGLFVFLPGAYAVPYVTNSSKCMPGYYLSKGSGGFLQSENRCHPVEQALKLNFNLPAESNANFTINATSAGNGVSVAKTTSSTSSAVTFTLPPGFNTTMSVTSATPKSNSISLGQVTLMCTPTASTGGKASSGGQAVTVNVNYTINASEQTAAVTFSSSSTTGGNTPGMQYCNVALQNLANSFQLPAATASVNAVTVANVTVAANLPTVAACSNGYSPTATGCACPSPKVVQNGQCTTCPEGFSSSDGATCSSSLTVGIINNVDGGNLPSSTPLGMTVSGNLSLNGSFPNDPSGVGSLSTPPVYYVPNYSADNTTNENLLTVAVYCGSNAGTSVNTPAIGPGKSITLQMSNGQITASSPTTTSGSTAGPYCEVTNVIPKVMNQSGAVGVSLTVSAQLVCPGNQTLSNGACVCAPGYNRSSTGTCVQCSGDQKWDSSSQQCVASSSGVNTLTININPNNVLEGKQLVIGSVPKNGANIQVNGNVITMDYPAATNGPMGIITLNCSGINVAGQELIFTVTNTDGVISFTDLRYDTTTPQAGTCGVTLPGLTPPPVVNNSATFNVQLNIYDPQCGNNSTYNENSQKCECITGYTLNGLGQCIPPNYNPTQTMSYTCPPFSQLKESYYGLAQSYFWGYLNYSGGSQSSIKIQGPYFQNVKPGQGDRPQNPYLVSMNFDSDSFKVTCIYNGAKPLTTTPGSAGSFDAVSCSLYNGGSPSPGSTCSGSGCSLVCNTYQQ